MTTNDGPTKHEDWPVLVAGEIDDYANISYLTDKDHRLPDWILRTISGQMRWPSRDESMLKKQALGYLREMEDKRAQNEKLDVKSRWRLLIICSEIGMRQVIREYEDHSKTNRVEEGDQPS